MGTFKYGESVSGSGIDIASNMVPAVDTAIYSSVGTDTTAYGVARSAQDTGNLGWTKSVDDIKVSAEYARNTTTGGSDTSFGITYAGVDGLTLAAGVASTATGGAAEVESLTYGAKYVTGAWTIGLQITSVDMTKTGVGYGASEIVNFNRQPVITLENGELAQCTPIINNGKIVSILIQNAGRNYHAPPDVEIESSTGQFAQLTPLVDEGKISEIKVIKGGAGYVQGETFIKLKAPGLTAQVEANIASWQVNLFERNLNNIESDDGVLEENVSHDKLEYAHIYAPRPLREGTYAISGEDIDNTLYGTPDLVKDPDSGEEIKSENHSPILGWAYDGHPIYGPYGFSNTNGTGSITEMVPGYELKVDETNRPPLSQWPAGFFVEDYVFVGNGNLDKKNGRFAITPDYPDGVYAYYATINLQNDSTGPFEGFRRPKFPYFIGDTFNSKPNPFNFGINSTQEKYDIESNEWLRNTRDYHTNSFRSGYDYIFNSNTIRKQTLELLLVEQNIK